LDDAQKRLNAAANAPRDYRTPNHFPTDYDARKALPIMTGVLDYFPDAIAAVAEVSRLGNEQHNPGEPLHWARGKSTDQINTAVRHMIQRGGRDSDGGRHLAKAAWRILAALQEEIEAEHAQPVKAEFSAEEIKARTAILNGNAPRRVRYEKGSRLCEHGRRSDQECTTCGRAEPTAVLP
jgi:hypothetical protein